MADSSQSEEALFALALAYPESERSTFLTNACAGNLELLESVKALLQAHEEAGDFLGPSHLDLLRGRVRTKFVSQSLPPEVPGDRVGRYRLLQKIGEGGCGVVYMAEQEEPVHRRVALKVIKLGMDTREVIARFEAERQALALLDHPHIARVFDGGATETGRPFFVMELVRGVAITTFCDEQNLPTAARLALFTQVCLAVQHAHQKGIIHRDLKPSNILVTFHDGLPVPKVIDFGIAKATQGRLNDNTVFTALEQFIGTPTYMSPEQAELGGLDIDTRSDIYSLGVLLYELLTSQAPILSKTFAQAGLDEMRRMIREVEPPKPSARLRTLEPSLLTSAALRRAIEPLKLVHLVHGDLDWIVMRCLEKNRTRRYETANALARDLQRYLCNEPVTAHPPAKFYLLQKLVRRHRLVFAAAGLIAAALVLGLGTTLWMYSTEKYERRRAVAAEEQQSQLRRSAETAGRLAETEAGKSKEIARFLTDMLEGVGPAVALGRDSKLLREILDKTAARLGRDLKDQPAVEAELRKTLGAVYRDLGAYDPAETMLRQGLDLLRRTRGDQDAVVATAMSEFADVLRLQSKLNEAETLLRQALALQKTTWGNEHLEVARSWHRLGLVLYSRRKTAEAVAAYREARRIYEKLISDPDPEVATNLLDLGIAVYRLTPSANGEALIRAALEMRRTLYGSRHPDLADAMLELGVLLSRQKRRGEAETVLRETLAIQRELLGDNHPKIALTLYNLAFALRGRAPAELERCLLEALAIQKRKWPDGHPDMVGPLGELARLRAEAGEMKEAEDAVREALNVIRQHLGEDHEFIFQTTNLLTVFVAEQPGRLAEAVEIQRESIAHHRRIRSDKTAHFCSALMQLGEFLIQEDKLNDAETALREASDVARSISWEDRCFIYEDLTVVLDRQHRGEEATSLLRESIQWSDATLGPNHRVTLVLTSSLAWRLYVAGQYTESLPLAEKALEGERRVLDSKDLSFVNSVDTAACIYEALGRPADALPLFREALGVSINRLGTTNPRTLRQMARLGAACLDSGQLTEANSVLQQALELGRATLVTKRPPEFGQMQRPGAERPSLVVIHTELGRTLLALEKPDKAETQFREALALQTANRTDGPERYQLESLLGAALLDQQKFTEAEPLLLEGYQGMFERREMLSAWNRRFVPQSLGKLIQLYTNWNQPEKALEWQQKLRVYSEAHDLNPTPD